MSTPTISRSDSAAKPVASAVQRNQISAFASLISGIPASLSIEADGDTAHVVLAPVAHCDVTDRPVQVGSRLTSTQAPWPRLHIASLHEFSFTILVVSLSDDTPTHETQDRTYARPDLPDACRTLITPIVSACLRALFAHVRPTVIDRVTKSRNPPEKALRKDVVLTRTLGDEGYAVIETGTDLWSRRFRVLRRPLTV